MPCLTHSLASHPSVPFSAARTSPDSIRGQRGTRRASLRWSSVASAAVRPSCFRCQRSLTSASRAHVSSMTSPNEYHSGSRPASHAAASSAPAANTPRSSARWDRRPPRRCRRGRVRARREHRRHGGRTRRSRPPGGGVSLAAVDGFDVAFFLDGLQDGVSGPRRRVDLVVVMRLHQFQVVVGQGGDGLADSSENTWIPREKLVAFNTGTSWLADRSEAIPPESKPVVPTTMPTPASTQASARARVDSGTVKSITTCGSCSANPSATSSAW